jgi:outer membrane protein
MTKTLPVALVLCAILAAGAQVQAQTPATPPAAARSGDTRSPRLAIIDMQEISNKSALGKSYAAKIEALENEIKTEGNKKNAELTKLDTAIKALQDELEKQASVLSAEAADKKRQDITRKVRERQAFLEDGQQELEKMKARAEQQAASYNAEFQTKIKPHIETVAKDRGVDIILTSQVALTMNREFDISAEVIAKADAAEKTASASKPAAAPAPAPSPSPKS